MDKTIDAITNDERTLSYWFDTIRNLEYNRYEQSPDDCMNFIRDTFDMQTNISKDIEELINMVHRINTKITDYKNDININNKVQ